MIDRQQPASNHFTPLSLASVYNYDLAFLPDALRLRDFDQYGYGRQVFRGIPFKLGLSDQPNVALLGQEEVHIALHGLTCTYLLFLHAVEDIKTNYLDGLADSTIDGFMMGDQVSSYVLAYSNGSRAETPIYRRVEIQQSHVAWGTNPFAAVPALGNSVFNLASDDITLGRLSEATSGTSEVRHISAFNRTNEHIWIYALINPHPELTVSEVICIPKHERSIIYAISSTNINHHPLKAGLRKKLLLSLPDGIRVNALGQLDHITIDLGDIISAKSSLSYDPEKWLGSEADVQPKEIDDLVQVEYSAHPAARLYLNTEAGRQLIYEDQIKTPSILEILPSDHPVHIRVVEKGTQQLIPVRLHLHGASGEYLPPKNFHRTVNTYWNEDRSAEFSNGLNQYCYIPGECQVDLPLGDVFIDIQRGFEFKSRREKFHVDQGTHEITFEVERPLNWRSHGWVSADTHVHFLSPQTALLEGSAEGVNVVNLLASQWGELFTNVGDFDGKTTFGAREFGGSGDFLVRVGTENRMQVLGHISLLGYRGPMILPLTTGGPSESAIGDTTEVMMEDWARRCLDQHGLVVLPHAPEPQAERAATIVQELVDAIEMKTFNPYEAQITALGIADWYRYLNLGYQVPVVGGSDKMSAASLLGGIRTYTQMDNLEFSYENWMKAVRNGNTFVTVGPLVEFLVNGKAPGSKIQLPASGGTVTVEWKIAAVNLPVERIEIVMGGLVVEDRSTSHQAGKIQSTQGSMEIKIDRSTWLAIRLRGSLRHRPEDIAAHTSVVQILVEDSPLFSTVDAEIIMKQIAGAITYVDTLAPHHGLAHQRKLRQSLEEAHELIHDKMHAIQAHRAAHSKI